MWVGLKVVDRSLPCVEKREASFADYSICIPIGNVDTLVGSNVMAPHALARSKIGLALGALVGEDRLLRACA